MKKKIENDMKTGMAYQRGMNVAVRYFTEGLPILLRDQEIEDLDTCLRCMEQLDLDDKTYFGTSKVLIAEYIRKLQTAYSNPETIRNGLEVLERMYGLEVLIGGDFVSSPYWRQAEKVDYFKTRGKR